MPASLTCPGCGEREGVRLVMGHPPPSSRRDRPRRQRTARVVTDAECRACGARWASGALPSR